MSIEWTQVHPSDSHSGCAILWRIWKYRHFTLFQWLASMILVDDDDDDDHNAEDDDGGMSQFQWFDEQFHSESVNLVGTNSAEIDELT